MEHLMGGLIANLTPLGQTPGVHRGQVLPIARAIVVAVPTLALCFYVFVVRRHRDQ